MPSTQNSSCQRPSQGRAASRSRLGCATCKRRHVRCNEAYPKCGPCYRLNLHCYYPHRLQQTTRPAKQRILFPSPSIFDAVQEEIDPTFHTDSASCSGSNISTDIDVLCNSWAGELECLVSSKPLLPNKGYSKDQLLGLSGTEVPMVLEYTDSELFGHSATLWMTPLPSPDPSLISTQLTSGKSEDNSLFMAFQKIMQPPGAMLMGGIKKWRHLQRYLMTLASRNEAVMTALWCLDTLLGRHGIGDSVLSSHHHQNYIQNSFNTTTYLIQQDLSLPQSGFSSKIDYCLAALFLLAWTQVLCDHVEHDSESLFPTELADTIITYSYDWNWYSRQLLSWFNSFDSKASHLGGPSLLSPKALHIVSQYPIQISSCNYEELKHRSESPTGDEDIEIISQAPLSGVSERGDTNIVVPARSPCDLKEIVLRAILQPAAEWYLKLKPAAVRSALSTNITANDLPQMPR